MRDTDLQEIAEIPMEMVANNEAETTKMSELSNEFNNYWYAGLAEISGYDLQQSRYGELHEGTSAMIFVTEPFSKKKQVKLDNPSEAGSDKVSVLKLNFTRKFLTGIYPYSTMTSIFNPVNTDEYQDAMKVTLSVQEWCGQVFVQLNKNGNRYNAKSYSYFESEGDENFTLPSGYLEDEIFNLIRLNPALLPKGEVQITPSLVVNRFLHEDLKPYDAVAQLSTEKWRGMELSVYQLKYAHNNRLLSIYFQPEFPYMIEGWEDSYQGFGSEALTTVAVRKNTKKIDYWTKNDNEFRPLNQELFRYV